MLIYSYLMLFGRTTPAKLREATGQSKATMFRNLAMLHDAEILAKEEVAVSDRRYGLHYYIATNLLDVTRQLYTRRVQEYAARQDDQEVLRRWILALETLPLTLNRFASELMLKMAQTSSEAESDECVVITKMIAFRVGDIKEASLILDKIRELVGAFEEQGSAKRRNWKKPLSQPATMIVNLVAMGGEIPEDSCAIVAERVEC